MEKELQDSSEVDILDDLDEIDKAIIKFKLEGVTNVDIADKLGKHRDTIGKRLDKIKVQHAIKELQKNALQILLDSQSDAARELKRQLKHGETDRDKREAAKEILKGVLSDGPNLNLIDSKFEIILRDVSEK